MEVLEMYGRLGLSSVLNEHSDAFNERRRA